MKELKISLVEGRGVTVAHVVGACLLLLALAAGQAARAQGSVENAVTKTPHSEPSRPASPAASRVPAAADDRYRIGPGDVLDIRVYNRPLLSRESVRVDGRGMIRMPLIEEEIQAACRTERELADVLDGYYQKYYRRPHVDVFIKDFNSVPVAVIGAVAAPGRFQLQRRVRLLELISLAGGPTERAGGHVQVAHTAGLPICEGQEAEAAEDVAAQGPVAYNLKEVLRGNSERANPYVRPGDIVSLPEAEQAYVVGNVVQPSAIALKEPITLSRAIAMVGGMLPDTKTDKIRIVRQLPGGTSKQEILVDLRAVEKDRAQDIALQANDIVYVPTSSGKRFIRNLFGGVAPAVTQLPVQVIRR